MDCIITAGGNPTPEDPLYSYTQGKSKAQIDMGGRTMLERVIDAIQESRHIEEIVVIGLGSDLGMKFNHPVHHLPDQGGLISNALAGINWLMKNRPPEKVFLACSADVPLITGPIVDQYIESCQPFDLGMYYIMVTKEIMETRFPGSNRSFVKLKDKEIAGGDMAILQFAIIHENIELWEMLSNARKHAWKIARGVGLGIMIKLLTRRLSISDIEKTGLRLIGTPVKVVEGQHAELAMDADKPHQVDLLRSEFGIT